MLSLPRPPVLTPHPTVAFVPSPEEAAWDCAASDCATSVDIVAAVDLFPIVGGTPSSEDWIDSPLWPRDDELIVSPVGAVEKDR